MHHACLLYDHTPARYIDALCTEYGFVPPGGAGAFGARSGGGAMGSS
jgi:methylthioribose-1-phosphate isomerase